MAQVTTTREDVERCKGCAHPREQRKVYRGYLEDSGTEITLEGCFACGGVLENDILVNPLSPHTVLIGMNRANVAALAERMTRNVHADD